MARPAPGVGELVGERAARAPDAQAVVVEGATELGNRAWEQRSGAVARGMAARGTGAGDRVALVFDSSCWTDYAVAYAAVVKLDATAVPMAPGLSPLEVPRILAHCQPAGVVCCPSSQLGAPCGGWVASLAELEDRSDGPMVETAAGGDGGELLYSSAPLRPPTAVSPALSGAGSGWPESFRPDLFLHCFAIGTEAAQHALRLTLQWPATTMMVLADLGLGRFCEVVGQRRPEVVGLTPTMARAIVSSGAARGHDLTSVRWLVVAPAPGSMARRAIAEAFPRASLVEWPEATWPPPDDGAEDSRISPVTALEGSLLWQEQFVPGRFNIQPLVRKMVGPLDVDVLEGALSEIASRHQALRTTFRAAGDRAGQVTLPASRLELPVADLTALPPDRRQQEVDREVTEATNYPFDLVSGPMFSPRLLRLGAEEHVLVVASHHATWDASSVGVFQRELSTLYTELVSGIGPSLPQPPLQFAEFCAREREVLSGQAGRAQRAYWERQLSGAPLVSQLPIDDPTLPPGSRHPPVDPFSLELSSPLTRGLGELARAERATSFMVLLAAFQALVHCYTDRDDVLVTSTVGRRNHTELQAAIGCFTTTVLLRLRAGDDPTFRQVVAGVREVVLGSLSNPDLPDDILLEEVLGPRAAAHGLMPRVGVRFQAAGLPRPIAMAGVTTTAVRATSIAAKRLQLTASGESSSTAGAPRWGSGLYVGTLLAITALVRDDSVSLVARGSFHRPAVERLLSNYQALLEQVVADPGRRLSELDVAAATPRSWATGSHDELPAVGRLHQLVEAQARRAPDREAATLGGRRLTYGELNARADRLAARLRGCGVGRGALVGLGLEPSLDLVVAVLAVWRTGAGYVALDPGAPPPGEAGSLAAIVVHPGGAEAVSDHQARTVVVDGRDVDDLGAPGRLSAADTDPDDVACVLRLVGSQGHGVPLSHRAVVDLSHCLWADVYGGAPGLRVCAPAAPAHRSFLRQLAALAHGHTLHLAGDLVAAAREVVEAVGDGAVDVVDCSPAELVALLGAGLRAALGERPPDSREAVITVAGDGVIEPELWAEMQSIDRARVYRLYSAPAVPLGATVGLVSGDRPRDTIGRPVANVVAAVLDRRGRPAAVQVPGELHVGAEASSGLRRTGQLARTLADGDIELLGQLSSFVDLDGLRVEPRRIEAALAHCPGVREIAVVPRAQVGGDERLVAYVVAAPDGPPTLSELRTFLWQGLPGYAWPAALVEVEELFRRPDGGLDTSALAAAPADDAGDRFLTPDEALLMALWAEAAGREVDVVSSYRQSFAFAEAVSTAYRMGLPVRVEQVMQNHTVEALATAIASSRRPSAH